jgi:predicted ATPase with chaperone activity
MPRKDQAICKYQEKLSGPIFDRIDLLVEMERLSRDERFA